MSYFPECERFNAGTRRREICEGSSDLPLVQINKYREMWGMRPLEESEVAPRESPMEVVPFAKEWTAADRERRSSRPTGKRGGCGTCGQSRRRQPAAPDPLDHGPLRPDGIGPGSQLLAIYEKRGMPHCDDCYHMAGQMDAWGVDGCRVHLDRIVTDILPRAKEWLRDNLPWLKSFLETIRSENLSLKAAIRRDVLRAIRRAEAAQRGGRDRKPKRPAERPKRDSASRSAANDRRRFPVGRGWWSAFRPSTGAKRYLTTEDLTRDTLSLVPHLPPDITHVYASARSGLLPGSLMAEMLHLPLHVVRNREGDLVPASHGWRLLEGVPDKPGKILVIDDTTMTGNSLLRVQQILKDTPGEKLFCSVYCNPKAATKPDLWAVELPWPHLLEWNLFNSVLLDSFALDFDGILCHDCPPEDDDDGPRYERFLRDAPPLHLVRKRPMQLIVTARLEKYRPDTLEWMERWRMRARQIIMGPWQTIAERRRDDVAAWKAEQLKPFLRRRKGIKPKMFIESDPRQAERIALLTGHLVVCPTNARCYE